MAQKMKVMGVGGLTYRKIRGADISPSLPVFGAHIENFIMHEYALSLTFAIPEEVAGKVGVVIVA